METWVGTTNLFDLCNLGPVAIFALMKTLQKFQNLLYTDTYTII